MATLEITITNKNGGPPLVQQKFEITEALARGREGRVGSAQKPPVTIGFSFAVPDQQ